MNSMGDDLAFAPAWQVREQIASKEISPLELVDLFLDRIETLNPKLNAYLRVTSEEARIQAAAAEKAVIRGDELGLLHGVPVSIKDLEATKGIPTTFGSAVFKGYVPNEDSLVVERIRQAGAIVLGKSNTPEFGLSGANENLLGDACRNPWNPERTSGGSSGGAGAALAAGLCSLASGSDGGGSIRIPSSFCGVFGIKPTQWRVPRYGGVRDAKPPANQFSQSGPMARSVKDAAILLQVLSGHDSRDPLSLRGEVPDFVSGLESGVRELRLGWSPDFGYSAVDPEVVELTSAAAMRFEQLGCEVEEARVDLEDPFPAFWTIFSTTSYTAYGYLLDEHAEELTDYTRYAMEQAMLMTAADYSRGLYTVHTIQAKFSDLLKRYDLLLSPTMATVAFPVGQFPEVIGGKSVEPFWGYLPFTFPINMSGQTAASVPCGFSTEGMPVGLHVIGKAGDEATVLKACRAFEQAFPWADTRPQVA